MTTTFVLGAGMVGVSTALALQQRGDNVLLIDRKGIGRETSYGNAGVIQTEVPEPHPFPRDLKTLLGVALKSDNAVNWHLASMPEHAKPLYEYWRNSSPEIYAKVCESYSQITLQADIYHEPLIEAAGANDLVTRAGYYAIYRTQEAFDKDQAEAIHLHDKWNVPSRMLTGAELKAVYPGLKITPVGGIHFNDVWTCRSPGGLTNAYGKLFQQRGGKFAFGDAQSLKQDTNGWSIITESGIEHAERVIVALGPWSNELAGKFGYSFPLFRKRGYHRHFDATNPPSQCIYDKERATFVSPMNQGLRVCTGAEFTHFDSPVDLRQIKRSEQSARELFDFGESIEAVPWVGHRPMTPDMLPILGEAPHHKGMWFHFGHGHQGFTGGPASAHILAEMIHGNPLPVTTALDPRRFL